MTREPLRIPLLRDWHSHPLLYAAFMDGIDLNRDPAETRDQVAGKIRAHAQAGNPGWTVAYGWNSGRYPLSKQEFDDLPPLVIFNLSLHGLIVNDAGLALLNRSAPDVAGNLADQDWIERNLRRVLNVFANDGASPGRLQRFFRRLLEEHGVYHAEEMLLVGENEIRLFEESGLIGRTRFWAAPDQYNGLSRSVQEKIHGMRQPRRSGGRKPQTARFPLAHLQVRWPPRWRARMTMAFSEALAARVRKILGRQEGIAERKMFGGLAFLLNGHMCCGVVRDRLMLRLGESGAAEALAEPHTRLMDFTGKPMKSMIYVDPTGLSSEEALRKWVRRAVSYVSSLPAKV